MAGDVFTPTTPWVEMLPSQTRRWVETRYHGETMANWNAAHANPPWVETHGELPTCKKPVAMGFKPIATATANYPSTP